MNGHQQLRTLIRLAQLLIIASTCSAVSLQDFQFITIIQVPSLSCLSAYGNKIPGCSRSDFEDGVQCSASCAEGIQQDQARIIAVCKDVEVNARSLLGLALEGGLLDALCPSFQATSVTSTVKPTTTRTFLTISQTRETSSTSIPTTTERSSTITTTTSISSEVESSTTVTSTPSDINTTVVSVTPTETGGTTTIPSTSTPSPTQTSNDQSDRGSVGGGGSPFDPVFIGGAESILPSASVLVILTGALITAFLMG